MSTYSHALPSDARVWRIAVAHAHPVLAAGLAQLLKGWGHQLVAWQGASPPPDLLVADSTTAAQVLTQSAPCPGVMVVETVWRAETAQQLLAHGALACLRADCSLAQLAEALACATSGRSYLCPAVAAAMVDDLGAVSLTPRECEVLQLLCEGLDNKTIALHLGLALTTVKSHVKALLGKCGAGSRTQMASMALRGGWV